MALGDSPTRTIGGHFLVVGTHHIHKQLCTRTHTHKYKRYSRIARRNRLPGTGDVQQLAPRVYSSRSDLVTPRYCTVGRSESGSDFAAVASFRGTTVQVAPPSPSLVAPGTTISTHSPPTHPLKHLQKQKKNTNTKIFQFDRLPRFYKFAIIIANFIRVRCTTQSRAQLRERTHTHNHATLCTPSAFAQVYVYVSFF